MSTANFSISPGPQVFVGDTFSYSPPPPSTKKGIVFFAFLGGMIALVLICNTYCCIRAIKSSRRKNLVKFRELKASTAERFLHDMAKEIITRFTAQELRNFTNNYSIRLGSGGFGTVYQGQFRNGVKIAVKVLNRNPNSRRVEEQFIAQVGTIGRMYHINLVRLCGYCFDQNKSGLVYEYMENSPLDKLLFSNETPQIECEKLQEIAVGTAKGLAYLHEECHQRIIHYDLKACFGMLLFKIARRQRNTSTTDSGDGVDWFPNKDWEEYEKGGLKKLIMAELNEIKEKDKENDYGSIVVCSRFCQFKTFDEHCSEDVGRWS